MTSHSLPKPQIVDKDLPCEKCSYNLRGLNKESLCPECGFSIPETIILGIRRREQLLQPLWESDPLWVRKVLGGLGLLLAANLLRIGLHLTIVIPAYTVRHDAGVIALWWTAYIATCIGLWLIFTPEPDDWCPPETVILRTLVIASLFVALLMISIGQQPSSACLVALVGAAVFLGTPILLFARLRQLLIRAKSRALPPLAMAFTMMAPFGACCGVLGFDRTPTVSPHDPSFVISFWSPGAVARAVHTVLSGEPPRVMTVAAALYGVVAAGLPGLLLLQYYRARPKL